MLGKLICCLILYFIAKCFFHKRKDEDDDEAHIEPDFSRFESLFAVAQSFNFSRAFVNFQNNFSFFYWLVCVMCVLGGNRLKMLYQGSKVYLGLQIPDFDSASRKDIDLVLVTNQEAVVISVKNLSGIVSIDKDDNWVCADRVNDKTESLPNPVDETRELVSILEHYLDLREVVLPKGYLSYKVICPNPGFGFAHSSYPSPPEVITQVTQIKPEQTTSSTQLEPKQTTFYSRWIKGAFGGENEKTQESFIEKLNVVLTTAPTLDRLEFEGNKCILGQFLEFNGTETNTQLLKKMKRSKVSRLTFQQSIIFGYVLPFVRVSSTPRDYQGKWTSPSSQQEVIHVDSNTEVVFQAQNLKKPRKYKLSSVMSISLSAEHRV